MNRKILPVYLVVLLAASGFIAFNFYSYIFSRTVEGKVVAVERVLENSLVVTQPNIGGSQVFSFAIAVKEKSGEIVTASSEDRQWTVVQKGQCVIARYYPYPPWNLQKSDTYFNARLVKLYECDASSGE